MQPLGLLGALLGGYQQGRLTNQNRQLRSAQLLRQQQENEALKKYREDSLELQRKRLAATEDPITKARRDHFYRTLDAFRPDVSSRTDKLFKSASTPEELTSGMESIYNDYAPRIRGLRGLYDSSPELAGLGSFEDLTSAGIPDWIRASKFDANSVPRPDLDMATFDKQIKDAYAGMSNAGVTDPAEQESALQTIIDSHHARTGIAKEKLWSYVSGIRPNQPIQRTTYQAVTGPMTPTQIKDPTLGAFQSKLDTTGQSTTEYSHAMPQSMSGFGAFKGLLKDRHGVGQGTSAQLADEMMIDDLATMFKLPGFAQKYGLNNIEDPVQFKRALEIYFNPNTLNDFRLAVNASQNYGVGSDGSTAAQFGPGSFGDFSSGSFGKGLAGLIEQEPLNAQTTTYQPRTYNDVTRVPIDIQDRNAMLQGDKIRQDIANAATNGELLASRARVARATEFAQISKADLDLQLKSLKVVLDPLKYKLAVANFDLDEWYKRNQIAIGGQRAKADWNRMLIDVNKPIGQLLASADNEVKSAGMNLTTLLNQNLLSSAVFKTDSALAGKVSRGESLTPEEIQKVSSDQALMTNQSVRLAIQRYSAALNERMAAQTAMTAVQQQGMAISKLKSPVITDTAPGSYEDTGGWEAPPDFNSELPANPSPSLNKQGGGSPAAKAKPKPAPAPAPPPNTSKVQTNPAIISKAQERFKNKGKGQKKPETATPPKDDWGPPPQ